MLRTLYTLDAGTFTAIPATQFARMVELEEDGTGTNAGLVLKFPDDNYTASFTYPPAQQPVDLGNRVAQNNNKGEFVGVPVQTGLNAAPATVYVMASAMAGTTVLRVTETD